MKGRGWVKEVCVWGGGLKVGGDGERQGKGGGRQEGSNRCGMLPPSKLSSCCQVEAGG